MVYVLLCEGFEELEALTVVDVLRRGDVGVKLVGVDAMTVKGSHGISVNADISFDEIDTGDISLIYLPGGMPGTRNLNLNKKVTALLNAVNQADIPIAAICAAPSVLGNMGILKNKRAVCYPGFESYLSGAKIQKRLRVEHDSNILTAVGAGASAEFAFEILSMLKDHETAAYVKEQMLFK